MHHITRIVFCLSNALKWKCCVVYAGPKNKERCVRRGEWMWVKRWLTTDVKKKMFFMMKYKGKNYVMMQVGAY